jgi:hypothetical protein
MALKRVWIPSRRRNNRMCLRRPDTPSLPDGHAPSAHPVIRCARRMVGVRMVVRVTGWAMRLIGVQRRHHKWAAPVVLPVRYQCQVSRVDTGPGAAQVVDLETFGDRPTLQFPHHPMHVRLVPFPTANADHPVPIAIGSPQPQPAIVWPTAMGPSPQSGGHRCLRRPWRSTLRAQPTTIDRTGCVGSVRVPVLALGHDFGPLASGLLQGGLP